MMHDSCILRRVFGYVGFMKIPVVELSECTLCGVCEEVAPSVFQINEAGYVVITDLSSYPENEVEEAIKNCPADCIYWDEI